MRAPRAAPRLAAIAAVGLAAVAAAGCTEDCCTFDSFPIALSRAPLGGDFPAAASPDGGAPGDAGALLAAATVNGKTSMPLPLMVIDTGSPISIRTGSASGTLATAGADFDLYDAVATGTTSGMLPPLRAEFRDIDMLQLPLQAVGGAATIPEAVLGGDVLRGFSVALRFGARCSATDPTLCTSMTFWNHLDADASFLEDAGYAVVNFTLYGGGEVTADGDPDFLGLRGPLQVAPSRIVFRTCAAPAPFSPTPSDGQAPALPPACCTAADALTHSSGVDLSLLLDTGAGPMVLSASAWARVVASAAALPAPVVLPPAPNASTAPAQTPLYLATWPSPIPVLLWATIPRYALVNLEIGANDDPGPCVELARSRRTEIVSYDTVMFPDLGACFEPCDRDPNETGEALNSAAYLEIGGAVPVAVIGDDDPFLQGLRFDVLPEGPEIDGVLGAGALGRARVELDYLSSSPRAVFSCEDDAARDTCFAAARCPRLPDHSYQHFCFGLPEHGLAATCAPSGC